VQTKIGKKSSQKIAKKIFLYSHENRVQKMGGKTLETIFPLTHQQSERKMLGKKSSQKSAKKCFLNLHEYRDQKGGKRAKQYLQYHTNSASKKC